jgi:hypothetical protein
MARRKPPWVKWYAADWLSGTRGQLTTRELAVYTVVLNTCYDRSGPCPDDARFITDHFAPEEKTNLSRRVQLTRLAIDQLVALGKLRRRATDDGCWLSNGRADVELIDRDGRVESASKAGVASGAARRWKTARRPPGDRPAPARLDAETSRINGLGRTRVPSEADKISSSSSTESVAARATGPAVEGPAGHAPDAKPKIAPIDPRLERAMKAARQRLLDRGSA